MFCLFPLVKVTQCSPWGTYQPLQGHQAALAGYFDGRYFAFECNQHVGGLLYNYQTVQLFLEGKCCGGGGVESGGRKWSKFFSLIFSSVENQIKTEVRPRSKNAVRRASPN